MTDAELIAVALPCLCEFVWVLLRVYGLEQADAASAIRALLAAANVEVNRPPWRPACWCSTQAETLPMASLPTKVIGSAGKPSFPSIRKQWHFSQPKDNQHAFCEQDHASCSGLLSNAPFLCRLVQ